MTPVHQYDGQHGCRTFIKSENRVCMAPETIRIDGRMYCDKHRPYTGPESVTFGVVHQMDEYLPAKPKPEVPWLVLRYRELVAKGKLDNAARLFKHATPEMQVAMREEAR